MPDPIDPTAYKNDIDYMKNCHAAGSFFNTIATIALCWLSFSPSSPITRDNPNQSLFNIIAYPIFAVLLILPAYSIYYTLSPLLDNFTDDDEVQLTDERRAELADIAKGILATEAKTFNITLDPNIQVIKNGYKNAMVFQAFSCSSQHILITCNSFWSDINNTASLEILLSHELMHFQYDLPYFHPKRFRHLTYLCNVLILSFGVTPLQIAYAIAGGVTMGFHPENVYLPLITLFICLFSIMAFFSDLRTTERNADYCALFNGKKFSDEEYEKEKKFYASHSNHTALSGLFRIHPHSAERLELLNASQEYWKNQPNKENAAAINIPSP